MLFNEKAFKDLYKRMKEVAHTFFNQYWSRDEERFVAIHRKDVKKRFRKPYTEVEILFNDVSPFETDKPLWLTIKLQVSNKKLIFLECKPSFNYNWSEISRVICDWYLDYNENGRIVWR